MFKKYTLLISLILLSVISYADPIVLDGIVADVNSEVITENQLNEQVILAKRQMSAQHIAAPKESVLKKQVLDMLISQTLQLQIAKRARIVVTSAEVDEAVGQMAKMQSISSAQLLQAVKKEGISETDFRKQLTHQIIIGQLQRGLISPQINVSSAEIDAAIRSVKKQNSGMQYHLEDILIPLSNAPTPDEIKAATARANTLITQLKAGTDFKTLAAAVSKGQEALQGGDLGWQGLAALPATFSNAIQNLQVGGVSQPLRAADGIHIISLLGVRSGSVNTMSEQESRQEISNMLFKRKFEERLSIWLKQAHDSAYIKIFLKDDK
jgi:peptidyl-prolyl cis-trans isomerase SurA